MRYFVVWGRGFLGIPTAPDGGYAPAAGTTPVAEEGTWSTTIDLPGVAEPFYEDSDYLVGALCAYDDGTYEHRAWYEPWTVEVVFAEETSSTTPPLEPIPPATPQPVPAAFTG